MKKTIALRFTVLGIALFASGAWATDGYFPHGYGIKAKGMGGVSIAMTDQAFAGANNPATASFAGNRAEVGVELFELMLDVASGRKKTWAEQWKLHNALVLFNPAPVT